MPKRRVRQRKNLNEPEDFNEQEIIVPTPKRKGFSLEFLNAFQRSCWETIARNDVVFLIGSAGTGSGVFGRLAGSIAVNCQFK
jgi:phosphate starvation-inducible protein PhoH